MAQVFYIKGNGYVQGPLSADEAIDHIRSGSVEPWYEIAEVSLGIKPRNNQYVPARTSALWSHYGTASVEDRAEQIVEQERLNGIVLTTESTPALPIAERLGIITAECVYGMNVFRDLFASVRDVVGGRSGATQNVLRDAKDEALAELRRQAFLMDADAVVAVDLDYTEFSGGGKSMLVCIASGTAVKLNSARSEPQSS
jgi:uncharacterized protein YbjQ (UPF0145 family)